MNRTTKSLFIFGLAFLLMGAAASTSLLYVDTSTRAVTGNIVIGTGKTLTTSGTGTIGGTFLTPNIGAATGTSLALSGTITASGTGTHTFGTGSTVTMAAGVLATTGNATVGGNLTVSGTGTSTIGASGSTIQLKGGDGGSGSTAVNFLDSTGATLMNMGGTGVTIWQNATEAVVGGGAYALRTNGGFYAVKKIITATDLIAGGNLTVSGTGAQVLGGTGATLSIGGTSAVKGFPTGTATWDPADLADGAVEATTVTVTGAVTTDVAFAGLSTIGSNNVQISAVVSAADTVRVLIRNVSGGNLNLASGTVRASVLRY